MKRTPKTNGVIYDSIEQASSSLNIPYPVLMQAKKAGCPGFKNSRVYVDKLMPWLKAREESGEGFGGGTEKEKLQCRKLLLECERINFNNEVDRGLYVLKTDINEQISKYGAEFRMRLFQRLDVEAPAKLAGLSAIEIREKMTPILSELLADLRGIK